MHCQRRILNRHVHLPNCFSDWLKPEIRKQKICLALSALAGVSALVDLKQSVQAESRERRGWIGDPACQATSSSVARKACEAAGYGGEGNALNQRDPETASRSTALDRCGPDARARPAAGILLRCYLISCRSVFRDFPSSMLGETSWPDMRCWVTVEVFSSVCAKESRLLTFWLKSSVSHLRRRCHRAESQTQVSDQGWSAAGNPSPKP